MKVTERIKNDAQAFIDSNMFRDARRITIVSPIGCYIAGATAERDKTIEDCIDAFLDKATEEGYIKKKSFTYQECKALLKSLKSENETSTDI